MNIRHMVPAALALAGMVAATAAEAAIELPNSGNGSLVLFVLNSSTNQVYAGDLGVNVDDIITEGIRAGQTRDPMWGSAPGVFSLDYSLDTPASAGLTAFLDTPGTFTWAVLGADTLGNNSFTTPRRFAFTTPIELGDSTTPPNSRLSTLSTSQTSFWQQVSAVLAGADSVVAPLGVTAESINYTLVNNFFNQPPGDATSDLGTTQNFYLLTSSGSPPGGFGGSPIQARTFVLNDLELTSTGSLVAHGGAPEVPLPAGLWLLGSRLMGLAGIGRRRN